MIYVVATLTVKPETRAELIAGATKCIAETRKEAGCIAYDMHESVTDPAKFVFVEQWDSAEALVPHGASDHMRAWRKIASPVSRTTPTVWWPSFSCPSSVRRWPPKGLGGLL